MTADPALDTLPEWPWPRWEFVTAMPDDDGITVALVPIAPTLDAAIDSTWEIERAAPSEAVRKAAHDLRWALVEHRAATEPAPTTGLIHGKPTDLNAYCTDVSAFVTPDGRTLDSTGAENTFDG